MEESMNKTKADFQRSDFASRGSAVLWLILILMSFAFVSVMIFDDVARIISCWLGIYSSKGNLPRHETLKFIGFMMSGVLAAIGVIAINRRAEAQTESAKALEKSAEAQAKSSEAQAKSAEAQMENNKLTQKGRDDARFQSITENLGHPYAGVRIAAFYRFYYYASKKGQSDQFKNDVFEILCSYLRTMLQETSDYKKKQEYQVECQTLCDILFKGKFKGNENENQNLIPPEITVDLKFAYLIHIDLSNADLSGADLSGAHLSKSNLWYTDLSNAKLSGTRFIKARICGTNFSNANLNYADFSNAIFYQADLSNANLYQAIFSKTKFSETQLEKIHNIEEANFCGAMIGDRPITEDDIPADKGEYYADWNPPPEKEEN